MCDPVTIAGMALSAAGSMMNNRTQQKYQKAQITANRQASDAARQLREAEFQRQDALKQKAFAGLQDNIDAHILDTQEDQMSGEEDRVKQIFEENIPAADTNNALLSGQQNAGTNFDDAAAKTLADSSEQTRKRLNAFARLQSFGGSRDANMFRHQGTNRIIGTQGGLRASSLGATQAGQGAVLNNPAYVASGSTTLGDVMMDGGKALGYAGGQGWKPSFSAGNAAPPSLGTGPAVSWWNT